MSIRDIEKFETLDDIRAYGHKRQRINNIDTLRKAIKKYGIKKVRELYGTYQCLIHAFDIKNDVLITEFRRQLRNNDIFNDRCKYHLDDHLGSFTNRLIWRIAEKRIRGKPDMYGRQDNDTNAN